MKFLTSVSWLLRALLFLAVLAFALMNTEQVPLRFFPGSSWQAPMIVALLMFFALGAAFGVLACLSGLLRQRREIHKLRRELHAAGDRTLPPRTEA